MRILEKYLAKDIDLKGENRYNRFITLKETT